MSTGGVTSRPHRGTGIYLDGTSMSGGCAICDVRVEFETHDEMVAWFTNHKHLLWAEAYHAMIHGSGWVPSHLFARMMEMWRQHDPEWATRLTHEP